VDRWLVSSAFVADTAGDPLRRDYLSSPGEAVVLPDRGRTVSGADWTMLREDGSTTARLPTRVATDDEADDDGAAAGESPAAALAVPPAARPDGAPDGRPVVAYAHTYIRTPADRTVRLVWGGLACTRVEAWLNGRPVDALGRPAGAPGESVVLEGVRDARSADVRLGLGYNTLLLKAVSGDCRFGVAAALEAVGPDGLQGMRVQASRPPGDTRTGPLPWVISGTEGGPEPMLGWEGDRLFGAVAVRLAGFAVTPIERVEVRARVGGRTAERDIEWLTPAEPRRVAVPFDFERLHRSLLAGQGAELELEWDGAEVKSTLSLDPGALLDGLHSSIRLLGWTRPGTAAPPPAAPADTAADPDPLTSRVPLPAEQGTLLVGEWKVPGWLDGFTLRLDTEGAPGAYRVDSREAAGGAIVLCDPCSRGKTVRIEVRSTAPWDSLPGVRIVGVERPVTDGTPVDEAGWLRLLREGGSDDYRARAAAAAPAS